MIRALSELTLGGEADAVPKARRFTAKSLEAEPDQLVEDAEQVVSELVTNAILHGAEPVTLRILRGENALRVEVEDSGRTLPVVVRPSTDAMTGRGLSLVAALASGWGVEESPSGKIVWAELAEQPGEHEPSTATGLDIDLGPTDDSAPSYTVRLGAVRTDLLLAAKAHIDNVVRELQLIRAEEVAGGPPLPGPVAELVETVTSGFVDARADIKRQALAAAARGDEETDLVLTLPISAAAAGARYLAALDAADRYARAAKLLTIAAPMAHRIFRRWYVGALVDQLRAIERGEEPPETPAFMQALAQEVERLATLEDVSERLKILQRFTGELTGAASVAEISEVVVRNACGDLGAQTVRLYLLTDTGVLRAVAWRGDIEVAPEHHTGYADLSLDADLPGPLVVRTGVAMHFRNREQLAARFPKLMGIYPEESSLHVAPLRVGAHMIGVISMTFADSSEVDDETQHAFVGAMADATAQALERALALERADSARRRLAFLAEASVVFTESLDTEATLDAVNRLLVPTLADWCIVQLLRDDELEIAALHHSDPGQVAWAKSMSGRFPMAGRRQGGAPTVVATGESMLFADLDHDLIESMASSDEHRDVIRALGMSSAMVVPLTGRSGTIGAVTLLYADSGRRYAPDDMAFVEDIARRAALALETAETFREQSGQLADIRRVADATQRAILEPVPARLGSVSLAGRYVSATAEALIGGDFYEVVPRSGGVRILVGDVRGKGLAAIRVATIVLGEFRAAAADIEDIAGVARQMDRRLRPYLEDEDFATAVVADVADDGSYSVVSCGHPAPLLVTGGAIGELSVMHSLPLGLGADPTVASGWLSPGDRLLLYTDGVIEARDAERGFVDLTWVVSPLAGGDLQYALDDVLERLHHFAGARLGDDVALVAAEFSP